MKKISNYIWFTFLLVSISGIQLNARTLYLMVLDMDNKASFNTYMKKVKVKRGDMFVVLDAQSSQMIFEKKIRTSTDEILYRKHRQLLGLFDKTYDKFSLYRSNFIQDKQKVSALNSEENDLARVLKSIHAYIKVYKKSYPHMKVILFGNSYLHRAYGYSFEKGIPTDGFIYQDSSEFNSFDDIDAHDTEFAIFYDSKPYSERNKMFRFYALLLKKKFNATLKSFNINAVWDADTHTHYSKQAFLPDIVKVIEEVNPDSCEELDELIYNDLPHSAEVEVIIINECRRNTMVSFSHNGKKSQALADKDGRVKKKFKKIAGSNIIMYIDLKGKWRTITDENTPARQDGVTIDLDTATSTVIIRGKNPLRTDGDSFEIIYENTGASFYPIIQNGAFEKVIPIKTGDNTFSWRDMNGTKHSKMIPFYPKCTDKTEFDDRFAREYGILQVSLKNSCREENSLVTFIYDDKKYMSIMHKGETKANIILKYDVNDVFFENYDRDTQKLATIEIDNFKDLIRFMISYRDNVVVAMNIYEPNLKINSSKPVYAVDYNNSNKFENGHLHVTNGHSNMGDILIIEQPSVRDYLKPKYIQNYQQVYVTRKSRLSPGDLVFYVDYFSRHGIYGKKKPLCDERSLGGIVAEYEVLSNGSSEIGKKFLNPSHCTNKKPAREDQRLIFIKKVEIK